MKKILFVCTGNICRSPTAHAVANHLVLENNLQKELFFDSCGLSSYHVGEAMDSRSRLVLQNNGIASDGIFARQINKNDFDKFDLIFAMDKGHLHNLLQMVDEKNRHKIHLFLEFCGVENAWKDEVIDPYYLQDKKFDEVFFTIKKAIKNLIKKCKN